MKPDNSKEYWIKRAEQIVLLGERDAEEVSTNMVGVYQVARKGITKEIEAFYQKYAKDNKIDLADVQQQLDPYELNYFHKEQQQYLKEAEAKAAQGLLVDPAHIALLKKQSAKAYVSKLDELKMSITENINKVFETQANDFEDAALNHYEEVMFTTEAALSANTGMGIGFDRVSEQQLKASIQAQWVGGSFSDKIWANKNKLINVLNNVLPQEFVRGKGPNEVAKTIADQLNVSYSNAKRLIRTEMNHISNKATLDAFKETGIVDTYEYTATLDSRTSEVCMDLDGKTFPIKDGQAGVNMPPMHPYCRSTIIPFFAEDDITIPDERAARNAKGKSVVVDSKNYLDWLDKVAPPEVAKKQLQKWANFLTMKPAKPAPTPVAPPKALLDFTKIDWSDWYDFTGSGFDPDEFKKSKVYKDYQLDLYTPEEIVQASINRAVQQGYNPLGTKYEHAILSPYVSTQISKIAVKSGFLTKEELKSDSLIIDMKLNGLTHQQSFMKFMTGSAADNYHDALYEEDGITLKNMPKDVYNIARTNMAAFSSKAWWSADPISADEMAHQLNTMHSILDPADAQAGITFFGAASKKTADYSLSLLYDKYKSDFNVVGVSAAFLDKFLKGKFATIEDAKAAFKISHVNGVKKVKSAAPSFSTTTNFYNNSLNSLSADEQAHMLELSDGKVDPTPVSMADVEAASKTARLPSKKEAADRVYRKWTAEIWKKVSASHKRAAFEYTQGSGKFNRPLVGYKHGWGGIYDPMVDLNTEGGKREIAYLYDTIDQSPLPKSIKVRRGGQLSELLNSESGILKQVARSVDDLRNKKSQLSGQVINIKNFLSTGVAEGAGFGGSLEYIITLPAGTKAIYAEPFSAYGRSNGLHWDGDPNWTGSVGGEAEIIVQADTDYIIESMEESRHGDWVVRMTAIPQSQHIDKAQDRLKNAVKDEVRKP